LQLQYYEIESEVMEGRCNCYIVVVELYDLYRDKYSNK